MSSYTEVVDYTSSNEDKSKLLLLEALYFLNKVPNKKYGDNYKLATKIEKYLKDNK